MDRHIHWPIRSPDLTQLDFCLCCWKKGKVCKRKDGTRSDFLTHVLDAAARIRRCEDQVRRTKRDLHTGVGKCTEVDGGTFGTFIVNVSFLLNKLVVI
jgi:hypothetical protein